MKKYIIFHFFSMKNLIEFYTRGQVMSDLWHNIDSDNSRYEFGNCFRTQKEAEAARNKIKEILIKE